MKIEATKNEFSEVKKNIKIGIKKYEINADKELNLNNFAIEIHIKSAITPTDILRKIIVPKPVATPLPPLKFNHIGKQCPITADTATKD